jgi:6-pyruvoyltetrahydropterin/6-carboxytetrahydropterin synthase
LNAGQFRPALSEIGMYRSTKTYGHELGLSACFRQHRAVHSHCSFLHGYALSFRFEFEAEKLDERNWVLDFGGLKPLKEKLVRTFDHKLIIAGDDPQLDMLSSLAGLGLADVVVLHAVGCEAFAKFACQLAETFLFHSMHDDIHSRGLRVASVECAEHGANSAIYINCK